MAKCDFCVKILLLGEVMVVCLTSDLRDEELAQIPKNVQVKSLENFYDINFGESDKIVFISRLKQSFFPAKFLEFINYLNDTKNQNIQVDVILIEEISDNSKIVADWLAELRKSGFNINLIAELDNADFVDKIDALINGNASEFQQVPNKNEVTIYTDGACSGNPGAGGWGAILISKTKQKEISGFEPNTTNNQMELTAVIKALEMLKFSCSVNLYSDSAYVVNAINQNWLENWKNNGWVGSDKKPVKNIELWQKLDNLLSKHSVEFIKVKGHADNEYNNRCDALATGEIAKHAKINE